MRLEVRWRIVEGQRPTSIQERLEELMEKSVRETNQYVSFRLAEEEYGISIRRVQEIIRYENLTRVPQSSEFVDGVLNLRGRVIPVLDLRRRLAMPEIERDEYTRIVIVEIDSQVVGFIVDSVTEVRTIDEERIDPSPALGSEIDTKFMTGMAKLDDRLIVLLNLEEVFELENKRALADATA